MIFLECVGSRASLSAKAPNGRHSSKESKNVKHRKSIDYGAFSYIYTPNHGGINASAGSHSSVILCYISVSFLVSYYFL